MKVGFVTCVQLGLDCMEEIYSVGGKLDLVVSLKDTLAVKKSGRIYVDEFCMRHAIELFKVRNINDEDSIEKLCSSNLDWLFIIGWSQIAKRQVLECPRLGVLGIHPTLLPQGRGRAAIPWAIIKGLSKTGVTLFKLEEGVDTGPICAQVELPIGEGEDATSLYERVCSKHRLLIGEIWPRLLSDNVNMKPQDESKATEWPERRPEDGRILPTMSVAEVDRLVRATTHPYPGAFWLEGDKTVRVWRGVGCEASSEPLGGGKRIGLSDGFYCAVDFEVE